MDNIPNNFMITIIILFNITYFNLFVTNTKSFRTFLNIKFVFLLTTLIIKFKFLPNPKVSLY